MDPRALAHVWMPVVDTAAAWEDGADLGQDAALPQPPAPHGEVVSVLPDLDPAGLARMEAALHAAIAQLTGAEDADPDSTAKLLELQAELQHQQQTYAALSNAMAMQHQASMTIIQNIGSSGSDYNHNGYADWSE